MTSSLQSISVTLSDAPYPPEYRRLLMTQPKFGTVFSDHMFTARWRSGTGWHDVRIGPREAFSIDPACAALHYAQEIFEGMKAYRMADGGVALFRPERNAARFADSATRLAMPVVPERLFTNAVRALVTVDRDWVPVGAGSLYLRPFMFASEAFLGVRPSTEYIFCVIACPVGPYFGSGDNAISLWISEQYARAGRGGTGAAKCGGNYAASLLAQAEAKEHGCDQVVFLDGAGGRWVEELGGMNVFFVMRDGSLITPPLGGTILPGITRDSIIQLARERGVTVKEDPYSVDDWRSDTASGALTEVFVCGTAATVAAVGTVRSRKGDFVIGDGGVGPLTAMMRDELLALQRGLTPDTRGWTVRID